MPLCFLFPFYVPLLLSWDELPDEMLVELRVGDTLNQRTCDCVRLRLCRLVVLFLLLRVNMNVDARVCVSVCVSAFSVSSRISSPVQA